MCGHPIALDKVVFQIGEKQFSTFAFKYFVHCYVVWDCKEQKLCNVWTLFYYAKFLEMKQPTNFC
jgi:hypothetical protein